MTALVPVTAPGAQLGEGPVWHAAHEVLVWVDIVAGEVHRLDPASGVDTCTALGRLVSAALPTAQGDLLVLVEGAVARLVEDGLVDLVPIPPPYPPNDAAVDPAGRLWFGTSSGGEAGGGALYRWVPGDPEPAPVLTGVTISNGIGWSPDGTVMYYVDSATRRLDALDYDVATGTATGRRELAGLQDPVLPDGIAVDAEGGIWVALWDGGAVHRYSPAGALDAVLPLPVAQVTSCAFGGPGLRTLFVTTAAVGRAHEPLAGAVFAGEVGIAGLPQPLLAVQLAT